MKFFSRLKSKFLRIVILILDKDSNNNFLDSLNRKLDRKPILIKLAQQGHCLNNLNLYEILLNTLND